MPKVRPPADTLSKKYYKKAAEKAGIKPDETGHWPSRDEKSGRILKHEKHPTFHKTIKGEKDAGYTLYKHKRSDRMYSFPDEDLPGSEYKKYKPK